MKKYLFLLTTLYFISFNSFGISELETNKNTNTNNNFSKEQKGNLISTKWILNNPKDNITGNTSAIEFVKDGTYKCFIGYTLTKPDSMCGTWEFKNNENVEINVVLTDKNNFKSEPVTIKIINVNKFELVIQFREDRIYYHSESSVQKNY